ncbi:hypothetical protein Gotri_026380, partial [Gossypium trilobum]|nr:hypothetical protein [Gossypium trilobum]
VVGRFFLLFSHRLVNLIRLVILQLNLSLNTFQMQANLFRKPLILLLRLTVRKESTCLYKISITSKTNYMKLKKKKEIALAQRLHGTEICHWWKAPIDQLNLRELYKQDESFAVFNNLISLTRDKKIAPISLMQAPMDEDVPSAFPPRYGPNLQL